MATLRDRLANTARSFADRVQGRAPMGEASTTGGPLYVKGILPYNPDDLARRKGGLAIYDKMRKDDQVKAIQSLRKRARLSTNWSIEPASDNEQDREIATFVDSVLRAMKGTLKGRLYEILSAMDYGFSVTEKVWEIIETGEYAGMIGLKELKTRKPHYWDFDTDIYDNLKPDGLVQNQSMADTRRLSPEKFIVFTWNGEFGNWYGESDLRAAYRPWWSKDIIIRFWNIYLEKFGMPTVVGKYPNQQDQQKAILEQILNDIQSRTGIVIPEDTAIEFLEAARRGEAGYEKAYDKYDTAIARALLVPDKLGFTESPGGSYNLGQKHFDLFVVFEEALGEELEETVVGEQIIKQLVDYNYPNVEEYPKFKLGPITEETKNDLADRFEKAVRAGIARTDRQKDLNHMRQALEFSELTDEEWEQEQEAEAEEQERIEEEMRKLQGRGGGPGNSPRGSGGGGTSKPRDYSTWTSPRELTVFEQRADFAEIQRLLDSREASAVEALEAVVTRQRDRLLKDCDKMIVAGFRARDVDRLQLKYVGDYRAAIAGFLKSVYQDAQKGATAEIRKAKKVAIHIHALPNPLGPTTPEAFFWAKAFTLAGTLRDEVLKAAKLVMYGHLRTGATLQETTHKLHGIFEQYLKRGLTDDQELLMPYRLENIVRTNATEAYTEGRLVSYRDPALEGYVVAVQYSAILDGRTTKYCEALDGKVFELSDPDLDRLFKPPQHYQCRSMLIAVTKGEPYTAITQEQKAQALVLKPKGM